MRHQHQQNEIDPRANGGGKSEARRTFCFEECNFQDHIHANAGERRDQRRLRIVARIKARDSRTDQHDGEKAHAIGR